MKLKKCYVSSFGKLKDYTYDFNDKLNTIKEDNGFGKSTLATFIKAVFYGLNDSKRSVSDNERTKYRPWNSTGTFGGYIEFEWGGQDFKIERFFGAKESEDTIKLYDLKTGRVHQNPEDIGRRIFEIDQDGFLSTTYFSQKDFQIKSNTSLTAKFNSVCEIQDTDAFDKALSKIEEKAKTYKYRGDKGLISETKQQIFRVNEKIEESNKAILTANSLKLKGDALQRETDELKTKINQLSEKEKLASKAEIDLIKKEQYEKFSNEIERLNTDKIRAEKVLNGRKVTPNEINAYLSCVREIENITVREQSIKSDIEQFETPMDTQNKNGKTPLILGLSFGVSLIIAIILSVALSSVLVPSILFWVLSGLLAISTVASLFVKNKNVQKIDERYQEILQKKRKELIDYGIIKQEYLDKVDAFISIFNLSQTLDKRLALEELSKVVEEYGKTVKVLENAKTEIDKFGNDRSFLSVEKANTFNLSAIHNERECLQEEYDYKMRELAKNQANVRYYDEMTAIMPELEEQKIQFGEKLAQYKEDFELLNLTAEFMKKADENLKIKYRAPLQESLNKYLKYIAGESLSAKIDIDLMVTVEENGAQKVTDYYSKGYQNLFEICKRFALTDVLFKGEKPFIVLDDPFYNLDDKKLTSAIELIKKLSEDYQIIYFVCHESRSA